MTIIYSIIAPLTSQDYNELHKGAITIDEEEESNEWKPPMPYPLHL